LCSEVDSYGTAKEIRKGIFFSFIVGEQAHCLKPIEFDFLRGRVLG
jgi:hypothetical protein